jgi:protoheme IX farnesyltransferase
VQKAWQLMQTPSDLQVARSVFKYSILYLMLLCAGMALDSLPVMHFLTNAIAENVQTILSAMPPR